MLPEALVIFACVNSTGCSQTADLYFSQHQELKHEIEEDAKAAREYVGPKIVDTVGPMLVFVAGGTGTIHLHNHLDLRIQKDNSVLSFSWIF